MSISPDDYESALVPVFGPAVAQEVAAQVRCITKLGTGAVDMTTTAAEFSVRPLPLREWISRHDWTSP